MPPLTLSIVIPAYNEAARIVATLETIASWVAEQGLTAEVVLVDDGSSDQTGEQAVRAQTGGTRLRCLTGDGNRGKGYAVRRGMLAAEGRFVMFTDADLSTPIEELERFLPALEEGRPLVIGSRRLAGSRVLRRQPLHRQWLGRVFSWLARRLLHPEVTDFTCGFKAFRREVVALLFTPLTLDGWSFDAELLHVAFRRGVPVHEVPVRWTNRAETRVRLLRDVVVSGWGLVRVVWQGWRGRYGPVQPPDA